jgi:hypothetical protein
MNESPDLIGLSDDVLIAEVLRRRRASEDFRTRFHAAEKAQMNATLGSITAFFEQQLEKNPALGPQYLEVIRESISNLTGKDAAAESGTA